jgi:hypothetical protein
VGLAGFGWESNFLTIGMWAGLGLSLRMVGLTKVIGKIVEAWQMLWFGSLIKLKTGEPVLRMICEFLDPVPIFKRFQRVWA